MASSAVVQNVARNTSSGPTASRCSEPCGVATATRSFVRSSSGPASVKPSSDASALSGIGLERHDPQPLEPRCQRLEQVQGRPGAAEDAGRREGRDQEVESRRGAGRCPLRDDAVELGDAVDAGRRGLGRRACGRRAADRVPDPARQGRQPPGAPDRGADRGHARSLAVARACLSAILPAWLVASLAGDLALPASPSSAT